MVKISNKANQIKRILEAEVKFIHNGKIDLKKLWERKNKVGRKPQK